MRPFLIALQFLTRIPVPHRFIEAGCARDTGNALYYYPLVGAVIGLLLLVTSYLLHEVHIALQALAVLLVWVCVTGGLHLDGLADSADAWAGSFNDAQRALDIMKDPACGPVGVIALVFVILIKFVCIELLIESSQFIALLLIPVIARCVPIVLFATTPYVRRNGLGAELSVHKGQFKPWVSVIITAVVLLCLTPKLGMLLIITMVITIFFLRALMIKRISGMTGDTVGGAIELNEVSALLVTSAVLAGG